jgi:D-aspartate ligase
MNALTEIQSMSVLIPDAETTETLKSLRCLSQAKHVKAYILSKDRWPMARFSRHCAGSYQRTSQSDVDWVNEIIELVKKLNIDIVLPVTIDGVELVSKNRAAISEFAIIPPLAGPELIKMANDKWALHEFVTKHGLPSLPAIFIGCAGEKISKSVDIDSIPYPAILKPTSQRGGFGIVEVESPSDFDRAWQDERIMKGKQYILQSFIPAIDYSLSVCCQKGEIIAYTLYRALSHSENRYQIGNFVEYVDDEKVIDLGRRLVSAMGWEGVADIDILLDERDQKLMILEFNPRFWQSLLGGMIAGVNFPLIWCLSAMGTKHPSAQRDGARYARPSLYIKTLLGRFTGRRQPVKIRWGESDLQFTVRDPLPELVSVSSRITKRFKNNKKIRQ